MKNAGKASWRKIATLDQLMRLCDFCDRPYTAKPVFLEQASSKPSFEATARSAISRARGSDRPDPDQAQDFILFHF
ncbi:MAG: hypothetical protein KME32_01170 [Mojavia pulchra JT2-VF2]|jgi:hypothetical protein|uniref:Uncharacterized protein n=1 Tax=Mojavia pulchra JT2-VF2 TaxID=287848 RepID=A0A951PVA7_9NOST|nr:hypothetical protein [Mojavia pulchra JT2-VF2]